MPLRVLLSRNLDGGTRFVFRIEPFTIAAVTGEALAEG